MAEAKSANAGCCGGHHDHSGHGHARAPQRHGARSRLRHDGGPRDQPSIASTITATPFISARPAAGPNSPPTHEAYLGNGKPKAEAPEGAIYTCPMHPQIRQVGPGSCPICGMALEPEVASLDTPPNPELADMTRRFWIGGVLALPAVVLEMGGHLVGGHGWVDPDPVELDSAGVRHARGAVGGLAILRARLAIAADAQSQHVHADRDGHRCRLCLQRHRHRRARHLPGHLPRTWRRGRGLLRSRRGHYRARAAGPGARVARPRGDIRRHQGAAATGAEDRAPHRRRRRRP